MGANSKPVQRRAGPFVLLLLISMVLLLRGSVTQADEIAELRAPAERGDATAQYKLGQMYAHGQGVVQGYPEAREWYRKAADQEHAGAQVNLGVMYADGEGVPQDYQQAEKWFRKAADQGDVVAQHNLGVMYADGEGVPQDYQQAEKWFRKAAAQGLIAAQHNLGVLYLDGKGVVQDYVQAHKWFSLAAAHLSGVGRVQAATNRDSLEAKMTPAQVTQARQLAREWRQQTQ